jgi:hypothetical protein
MMNSVNTCSLRIQFDDCSSRFSSSNCVDVAIFHDKTKRREVKRSQKGNGLCDGLEWIFLIKSHILSQAETSTKKIICG